MCGFQLRSSYKLDLSVHSLQTFLSAFPHHPNHTPTQRTQRFGVKEKASGFEKKLWSSKHSVFQYVFLSPFLVGFCPLLLLIRLLAQGIILKVRPPQVPIPS